MPVVATVHHPVSVDRDLELAVARPLRRLAVRRWYAFARMQARVARRIRNLATVSATARDEITRAFRVPPERIRVIEVGVDPEVFTPPADGTRLPGRVVAIASADVASKGVQDLVEAVAKLRTEHAVELVVVGTPKPGGPALHAIDRLGLGGAVRFVNGLSNAGLAALLGSAEVAVVPSWYEGVLAARRRGDGHRDCPGHDVRRCAARGDGPNGSAALHVPPGDPAELAGAIARLLDDPALRARLGAAGRARVLAHFTWRRTAERTAAWYADVRAGRC